MYVLLFSSKFISMSYEIQLEYFDQDGCIFFIGEVPYEVELYIETRIADEPESYNSFNDRITYTQVEEIYYRVDQETLICDGINYYNESDLCEELEEILNQN